MENKKVILLSAYAQSGKDTVADYLVKTYGYHKLGFADPLYDMLIAMYSHTNITKEDLIHMKVSNTKLPGTEITVRRALQTLGTEWGRRYIGTFTWSDIVREKIKASNKQKFVVTDCRFMDEFLGVKRWLSINHRLLCVQRDLREQITPIKDALHTSENGILSLRAHADEIVTNNETKSVLYQKLDYLIDEIWR